MASPDQLLGGPVAAQPSVGLPASTWSARAFDTQAKAEAFSRARWWTTKPPEQLTEDVLGPDGQIIRQGSWVVAYQVFDPDDRP